ncbi:MAG TPA: DNA polymerase III subunit gamma/tau, partial [Saprospiraceae bacterium]|nr:DNA polymerase III subunit gamma/tau [Saprospiraceae bacterium]
MSQFIVSARKYRPTRFNDVIGQEHVSVTLRNALQTGHLAHAFLFTGPRGVGKTTCARILARVINCENPTKEYDACNECASCKAFNENASFNILELDAASNNGVDQMRALTEQVRFQPQQGKYKVFIIDEVHMLTTQAFNAFLKTLEEPPPHAIFILATTEKHKIIPTILSRCQIYDFKRIQIRDMVGKLQEICKEEGIDAEEKALHIIAQKADGAMRDALSIFDRIVSFSGKKITYNDVINNLNVLDYVYYFRASDCMMTEDAGGLLMLLDEISNKGFEEEIFMSGLADHLRNLLICKDQRTVALLELSEDFTKKYIETAPLFAEVDLLNALAVINHYDIHTRTVRNKKLHTELHLLRLANIRHLHKVDTSTTEVSQEKKTPELSQPKIQLSNNQHVIIKASPEPAIVGNPAPAVPKSDTKPVL